MVSRSSQGYDKREELSFELVDSLSDKLNVGIRPALVGFVQVLGYMCTTGGFSLLLHIDSPLSFSLIAHLEVDVWKVAAGL